MRISNAFFTFKRIIVNSKWIYYVENCKKQYCKHSLKRFIFLNLSAIFYIFTISVSTLISFCGAQNTFTGPLSLPPLTELVTDVSNVLNTETLSWLNTEALAIEQQTSAQIATILFPHRNGNELFDIGMRLFRESGIWQQGKNNWLLLLISTEEKKLRIIVWYGLEWAFPDIWVRNLIESTLRPAVDIGQRAQAIQAYHQKVLEQLVKEWNSQSWVTPASDEYIFSIRDMLFFLIRASGTLLSFRALRTKTTSAIMVATPFFPFLGVFLLIALWLPGILGAFFGYFTGIIWWLIAYPRAWWSSTPYSSWWRSGWWFGWGSFSWGGFGWFGWWSSGGGGAGD